MAVADPTPAAGPSYVPIGRVDRPLTAACQSVLAPVGVH